MLLVQKEIFCKEDEFFDMVKVVPKLFIHCTGFTIGSGEKSCCGGS